MSPLRACLACLTTESQLIDLNLKDFIFISGLNITSCKDIPEFICFECASYIRKFKIFRDKCHRSYYTLQEILNNNNNKINLKNIKALNLELIGIKSSLSYIDPDKIHYEVVNSTEVDPLIEPTYTIPAVLFSTLNDVKENLNKVKIEYNTFNDESGDYDIDFNDNNDDDILKYESENEEEKKATKIEIDYATILPISMEEAKVVFKSIVKQMNGKFQCKVCQSKFKNKEQLDVHLRRHDTHVSGTFNCDICNYYFKTDKLYQMHMNDHHRYKFTCKQCEKIHYSRPLAKQHYIYTHNPTLIKKRAKQKQPKNNKAKVKNPKNKKIVASDFPITIYLTQEQQYREVVRRQTSNNYLDSDFKCQYCFKGFRETKTYDAHMRKHDPSISGPLQCDICKQYFRDLRVLYKHMRTSHLYKYQCRQCTYSCSSRNQAMVHYKFHQNITYKCTQCAQVFQKQTTLMTHMRVRHPSTAICNLCGHSYISDSGLRNHQRLVHTAEEISISASLPVDVSSDLYCEDCNIQFLDQNAFNVHLGSSNKHSSFNISSKQSRQSVKRKERLAQTVSTNKGSRVYDTDIVNSGVAMSTNCEVCDVKLKNDSQAQKHYRLVHPGTEFLKRYMCDVCGHTTKMYSNLLVHMRTHTNEKPYACPHCDKCFSMPSNRDRHVFVHTGEKKYQCSHCNRRFTQSNALKLHVQTVHLKIPYAPWDRKNRKRKVEMETGPKLVLNPHIRADNSYEVEVQFY